MTEPRPEINYARIFAILPEIMGFPMVRKGSRYFAPRYLTGEVSPRKDKMAAWLTKTGGDMIMVAECGSETLPLYQWMVKYGGCADYAEAHRKLLNLDRSNIVIPEERYRPEPPLRYVYEFTVQDSEKNRIKTPDNFTLYLRRMIGNKNAEVLLREYRVGAIPRYFRRDDGKWVSEMMTVYWYIDPNGKVCHDKRILYDANGHRNHEFTARRQYRIANGFRGTALYGEHLYPVSEPRLLVESEKTAIICRAFYGRGNWVAYGGKNMLKYDDVRAGDKILPDYDCYEEFTRKFGRNVCVKWWECEAATAVGYEVGVKDDPADMVEYLIDCKTNNN
jgi:hypothetical protein